jgi:AcrR family transcriptional regulator
MSSGAVDPEILGPLPPGRHGLSREQVASSQRNRLLRAVVDVVGESGYSGTTIADVTSRAGVSKKTFYVYFSAKEECFLAAYDAFAGYIRREIDAAYRNAPGDWRRRYRAAIDTYLALMSAEPARTRALLVEVFAGGPNMLAHRRKVLRGFEDGLRAMHAAIRAANPRLPEVPDEQFIIVVGGQEELLRTYILEGRAHEIPSLSQIFCLDFERLFYLG